MNGVLCAPLRFSAPSALNEQPSCLHPPATSAMIAANNKGSFVSRLQKLFPAARPSACTRLLAAAPALAAPPATNGPAGPATSPLTEHLAGLKKIVPPDFTIVLQPPFVVVGDETPEMVQLRATRTVKWAVDKLRQDYFKSDPAETIDIWLFRSKESYERHARELFNDTPKTPLGYYSAENHVLMMNISTGGGTL